MKIIIHTPKGSIKLSHIVWATIDSTNNLVFGVKEKYVNSSEKKLKDLVYQKSNRMQFNIYSFKIHISHQNYIKIDF